MRKAIDFFLFSSLFISSCAVLMACQTSQFLHLEYNLHAYLAFVFFATLSSYNFHWLLTPRHEPEKQRTAWTLRNRSLHILFLGVGLAGIGWWGFIFIGFWWQMGIAALLTFLYTAPKIPHPLFSWLKKIAIGKTIFLAFVWTYVTALLPVLISQQPLTGQAILFTLSRFFLVYAICIVFDYRDKEQDKKEGIRNIVSQLNDKGVDLFFYSTLILSVICTVALYYFGSSPGMVLVLLLPAFILPFLYHRAKKDFSDYLYDFALDGMMAISSVFTLFMQI